MAIYNRRTKFTREQLLDHFQSRNSITDIIYCIFRVLCIVVQNLYCIPSYLVISWLVLLPVSWFKTDLYTKLENYLYNSLLFIVSSWSLAAGLTVVESGDNFKHLIEEPEKHYPATISAEKLDGDYEKSKRNGTPIAADDIEYRSQTKRYLDDLSDNNNHNNNGYTTNSNRQHRADQNSTFAKPKDELGNPNNMTANSVDGLLKHTTNMTNDQRSTVISRKTGQITGIKNTENDLDRKRLISTAEKNINHNNNIISESDRITAKKSVICNGAGSIKHNTRELALAYRAPSNEVKQNTLKNIQEKPRLLFMCNHISTADVPLIMQSFSTLTNQSLLWVLDAQFKVTNFGVVCGSHGDFFVAKNSFVDGALREHALKFNDRNILVLFPEGGLLRKRIDGSNRYAARNNLPMTKYVAHPRFGAFKDLIDPSVGVTHIVDATLMYDDIKNPPSILDIVLGNRKQPVILNYKVYNRSEINPNEEWLRSIWLEKDKLLTDFYENRGSVLKRIENSFSVATLDWFKTLSVHLFYILVFYLAIFRLFSATSVTMLKARELYYSNI